MFSLPDVQDPTGSLLDDDISNDEDVIKNLG